MIFILLLVILVIVYILFKTDSKVFRVCLVVGLIPISLYALFIFFMSFLYGSPDSFVVNLVGKDMPGYKNRIESQKEFTSLERPYLLLCVWKGYDEYKTSGDGNDKSDVFLYDTKTEKKVVLLTGDLGLNVEKAFINEKTNKALVVFSNVRGHDENIYLYEAPLSGAGQATKRVFVNADLYKVGKEKKTRSFYVRDVKLCSELDAVYVHVKSCKTAGYGNYDSDDYYKLALFSGAVVKAVDKSIYESALNCGTNIGYEYDLGGRKVGISYISPESDYLPANYKPKYSGIYVIGDKEKLHISGKKGIRLYEAAPVWINGGKQFVWGRYLFDSDGKKKEKELLPENTSVYDMVEVK